MLPLEAIERDPPNVWLTSFYGFDPANWGYLGFSVDAQRRSFLNRTEPGVLVVIYAAGKARKDVLGRVVGVLQCSHRVNNARAFMSPVAWAAKQGDAGRWELGVKATRAWRVAPDARPSIETFADVTYRPARAQAIGSQGMPLTIEEARKLLSLMLQEVQVFGEEPILAAAIGLGSQLFAPSKAGPVSQSPYVVREAEGPKSLYTVPALDGVENASINTLVIRKRQRTAGSSRYDSTDQRCSGMRLSGHPYGVVRINLTATGPNSQDLMAGVTRIDECGFAPERCSAPTPRAHFDNPWQFGSVLRRAVEENSANRLTIGGLPER